MNNEFDLIMKLTQALMAYVPFEDKHHALAKINKIMDDELNRQSKGQYK